MIIFPGFLAVGNWPKIDFQGSRGELLSSDSDSRAFFGLNEVFKISPLGPGTEWQSKPKSGTNPDFTKR